MLPDMFQFSQSSLQDYMDCPRRFELRYVQYQAWPAVRAEPFLEHERHIERGVRFHRLVERHQLGIAPALLGRSISDDQVLRGWWESYLGFDMLHSLDGRRYPEFTMSTWVGDARVEAVFDLLVVSGERVMIFDWKTYRRSPGRAWFAERVQTWVYPLVLVMGAGSAFGRELAPESVEMVYWIAGEPEVVMRFEYSLKRFSEDRRRVEGLLAEIAAQQASEGWSLTGDSSRCGLCEYRSLCGRGVSAGVVVDGLDEVLRGGVSLGLFGVEELGF